MQSNFEKESQMDHSAEQLTGSSAGLLEMQKEAYSGMSAFKNDRADSAIGRAALPDLQISGLNDKESAGNCRDYLDKFNKGNGLDAAEQTAKAELDSLTSGSGEPAKLLKAEISKWSAVVNSIDIQRYGLTGKGDDELLTSLKDECGKGLSGASGLKIATILEAMRKNRE